ncbi:MAG: TylF/MycF/NovP-related O-methyltransferase [Chthoniobacterales bacterium]
MRRFHAVYSRFREFTMVPEEAFVTNLEIAAQVASVPGAIVECGTWRGGMIAGIASLLGSGREYYLFDSFEGLPQAGEQDGAAARSWQAQAQTASHHFNCRAAESDAAEAMSRAGIKTPHIVKGWFSDTLPRAGFPGGIALLRMDADWYDSTIQVLDALFSQINAGGVVLVDDYYLWDGCSRAIHDYLSRTQARERINAYRGVCFINKLPREA